MVQKHEFYDLPFVFETPPPKKKTQKTPGHILEFYITGLDMLDAILAK